MSHKQYDVRAMLDIGDKVAYEGEPITTDDLGINEVEDVMDAVAIYRDAYIQYRSAAAVLATCGKRLAMLLGKGGAARIGGNIVRFKTPSKEYCIDKEGFAKYLHMQITGGHHRIDQMFNVDSVRKSWMSDAERATFFTREWGKEPTLTTGPRDRAPQFLQHLEDGDVFTKPIPEDA